MQNRRGRLGHVYFELNFYLMDNKEDNHSLKREMSSLISQYKNGRLHHVQQLHNYITVSCKPLKRKAQAFLKSKNV